MKGKAGKDTGDVTEWLLFFYSVPSKPVSNRMRVWRRLMGAGAVQMKGAVYVLPSNEEHYELLQWLTTEITSMEGEAAFVKVGHIESVSDTEIIDLFNRQRERDYHEIGKRLEEIEGKLNSIKKGTKSQDVKAISAQLGKLVKDFETIESIDFFSPKEKGPLQVRIDRIKKEARGLMSSDVKKEKRLEIKQKQVGDYRKKIWATRKRPFIDRMASAWLIRKFIDADAVFTFIDEREIEHLEPGTVSFDIQGGEFTHVGDRCTFEVLIKSFGLKDAVLRKIAEIVHKLDIKDDKYKSPEAKGIEEILSGIRKTVKDDKEMLEKGMAIFEMLYASKLR